jgi:hypothetical protein
LKRSAAQTERGPCPHQLSCQKEASFPLPIVILVKP